MPVAGSKWFLKVRFLAMAKLKQVLLCSFGLTKSFGKGSRKLFHHLFKLVFAYAAEGANPIVGNVFKGSSGFNATFGVANGRVVHPLAHNAIIFFHVDVNKM